MRPDAEPAKTLTAHVDDVRALVEGGTSPAVATVIADSWRRSVRHHHVDPEQNLAPTILTEGELKDHRQPLASLVELAGPMLDHLYSLVRPIDYVVLLTNAQGIAIEHRGNAAEAAQFKHWGLWRGAMWSEQIEGTNGIGTCIQELRPVTVHRDEHFRGRHINLSCCGAPIFTPDGSLAAVLDVSSMNPELSGGSHALALSLVTSAAQRIERLLFRDRFHANRVLELSPPSREDGPVVMIALDRDLRIAGADRHARELLRVTDRDIACGIPLASHFAGNPRLVAQAPSTDALVQMTSVADGALWSAAVTPASSRRHVYDRARTGAWKADDAAAQPLDTQPHRGGLSPSAARRVQHYLERHASENVPLPGLAALAGLSVHHFVRAFKQTFGMPPHRYLLQLRVERARNLLVRTNLPLSEIALKLGFADHSHFTRHFRRLAGIAPSHLRRLQ